MGPYSEEVTQAFLKQGGILRDDLAWTPGLAEWAPLAQVLLFSSTTPAAAAAPVEQRADGEHATPKQKAFMTYLGIPFSSGTTKEQAAMLVNEAMENPKLNARVLQWNDDRLTLHPDLFAAEAEEKKEGRAQHFFETCNGEGADRLSGVTLAHCKVLVTYLDVHFPMWDANPHDAARKYFFPAVAEKFPQLVRGPWRGKLEFPEGEKAPPDLAPRRAVSPFFGMLRGMALGLVLMLVAYVGMQIYSGKTSGTVTETQEPTPAPAPPKTAPAPEPVRAKPAEAASEPAPSDPNMAAAEPAPAESAPAEPALPPAPSIPKTILAITKRIDARIPLGMVKLNVGQQLPIISIEGTKVKVKFGPDILTIPIDATDLATP